MKRLLISSCVILAISCLDVSAQKEAQNTPALTIRLNVTVIDSDHRRVTGLTQDKFKIFEDDVAQVPTGLQENSGPLRVVLALDASGSMRSDFGKVVAACVEFIKEMEPTDECALVFFVSADRIVLLQDFTSDKELLLKAVDRLHIASGHSAVVDALYFANQQLAKLTTVAAEERRVIVAFTDGEDRQSNHKEAELLTLIEKNSAPFFLIAPEVSYLTPESGKRAERFLNSVAVRSGGLVHRVSSIADYQKALTAISTEMRAPYILSYNSTNAKLDGKPRKVRVEVVSPEPDKEFVVYSRTEYRAPKK